MPVSKEIVNVNTMKITTAIKLKNEDGDDCFILQDIKHGDNYLIYRIDILGKPLVLSFSGLKLYFTSLADISKIELESMLNNNK